MDAAEVQTKFILERINSTEKNFSNLHHAIHSYIRQEARLRDKQDNIAKVLATYSQMEAFNLTMAQSLGNLSKATTLLADMKETLVKRMSVKVTAELGQYEAVCKRMRESIKESIVVRDKELSRSKKNGRKPEAEVIKAQLDTNRILRDIDKQMESFEHRKLQDLKGILQDFILIQLKMHSGAVELLSSAYQDLNEVDEKSDLQQIKKHLGRRDQTRLSRIHKIRSQSMGALSSMFGDAKKPIAMAQSSTSVNSIEELSEESDKMEPQADTEDSETSDESDEEEDIVEEHVAKPKVQPNTLNNLKIRRFSMNV